MELGLQNHNRDGLLGPKGLYPCSESPVQSSGFRFQCLPFQGSGFIVEGFALGLGFRI